MVTVEISRVHSGADEAFGNLERVVVTLNVYPRLFELHHFGIQNTWQVSQWRGVRVWCPCCSVMSACVCACVRVCKCVCIWFLALASAKFRVPLEHHVGQSPPGRSFQKSFPYISTLS